MHEFLAKSRPRRTGPRPRHAAVCCLSRQSWFHWQPTHRAAVSSPSCRPGHPVQTHRYKSGWIPAGPPPLSRNPEPRQVRCIAETCRNTFCDPGTHATAQLGGGSYRHQIHRRGRRLGGLLLSLSDGQKAFPTSRHYWLQQTWRACLALEPAKEMPRREYMKQRSHRQTVAGGRDSPQCPRLSGTATFRTGILAKPA
ncbi:unannotated protein [freshwater metagenome]|uniref:Unannotated protein n=1 Tax=freshwater metagenome TaxID=449393 RepID=A0A6J7H353_9ZZZZ